MTTGIIKAIKRDTLSAKWVDFILLTLVVAAVVGLSEEIGYDSIYGIIKTFECPGGFVRKDIHIKV